MRYVSPHAERSKEERSGSSQTSPTLTSIDMSENVKDRSKAKKEV